jgi:exodeoxyribonuclease-3
MRVISWNVNGIRAAWNKGFPEWLTRAKPQILCLQETRALPEQLAPEVVKPKRWHTHWVAAERKGYSGVSLWSRRKPDEVITSLGDERFDREGRFQLARFGRLWIGNGYFPNGNGKDRDNSRVPYKLDFYRAVYDLLEPLKASGEPVIVMGDFNTSHRDIDLARPKQNQKTSGFMPIEREELDRWLTTGWTDTFRHLHDGAGHYTWWSQRFGVREKNIGWRLDMLLASPGAMPFLQRAFITKNQLGSDHCPTGIDLDRAILG